MLTRGKGGLSQTKTIGGGKRVSKIFTKGISWIQKMWIERTLDLDLTIHVKAKPYNIPDICNFRYTHAL